MANRDKLLQKALNAPKNLDFDDLCSLAIAFGFVFDRQKGSHRFYKREGYVRAMDFQPRRDGKAKPYQVRQLLDALRDLGEIE